MEKHHHHQQQQQQGSKPKNNNNIFKMLPKAVSFGQRAPPFSPGRDFHHHHRQNQTGAAATNRPFCSGPIVRLVPFEARVKKTKNDDAFDEPTSPKVSCIGQIKLAKSKCSAVKANAKKNRKSSSPQRPPPPSSSVSTKAKTVSSSSSKEEEKRHVSTIKRLFSPGGKPSHRKSMTVAATDHRDAVESSVTAPAVPSLGQMKKFASSRDALAGFDWTTAEMTPEDSPGDHRRNYYSDEETTGKYRVCGERIIPYSAPILLDNPEGLKLKKEVNIWKRRTMNPPKKLQIKGG